MIVVIVQAGASVSFLKIQYDSMVFGMFCEVSRFPYSIQYLILDSYANCLLI